MNKIILVFVALGFISMTAVVKYDHEIIKAEIENTKYKACIAACNQCMKSCDACETMCKKENDQNMLECIKLCDECSFSCKIAVKAMSTNSEHVNSKCLECAKMCENCAAECDKFMMKECKKCAVDCRKAANLCNEMARCSPVN